MIDPNFVIVGAVIGFFGGISYLIDTLKGKTKPNKVTWFLWSLAPLIAFSAELSKGVGIQSLMTFMVGFSPLLIFLASFVNKKSYWQLGKFDYLLGALSLTGLILWFILGEGNYAIFFGILADFLAAIPTLVKSFKFPETENYWIFLAYFISSGLTILTIDVWDFAHYGFPVYIFVLTGVLFSFIRFKLGKRFATRFV